MACNFDGDAGLNKEKSIKFFLEAFKDYIQGCLKADCMNVILKYKEFTVAQKEKLMSYCDHEPTEKVLGRVFDEIRKVQSKSKYRALLDAVEENQKVVYILTGKAIPTEDQTRKILYEKGSIICNQLNVVEVLPSILAKDVITDRDCEKIQAINKNEGNWKATLSLIFLLPNRQVAWFPKFIESLEESKHKDLAGKLKTKHSESTRQRSRGREMHSLDMQSYGSETSWSMHGLSSELAAVPGSRSCGRTKSDQNLIGIQKSAKLSMSKSVRAQIHIPLSGPRSTNKTDLDSPPHAAVPGSRSCGRTKLDQNLIGIPKSAKLSMSKSLSCPRSTNKTDLDSPPHGTCERLYFDSREWLIKENIGRSWWPVFKAEFDKPYFQKLLKFVEKERHRYTSSVIPKQSEVFCWTNYCALDEVKVVIMAENAKHGHAGSHGLAFSINPGHPVPKVLKNIFKEIQNDIGHFVPPNHGCLKGWAKQGVLLLNSILTWRGEDNKGIQINTHRDQGWEEFTDKVISYLCQNRHNLVFMLWGNYIKRKGKSIDEADHCVLKAIHPSPFSASKGFFGCEHFSKCNKYLEKDRKTPINWQEFSAS